MSGPLLSESSWTPTLETIPPELKRKIARHLDPRVHLEDKWSRAEELDADERRKSIMALSLVSHSWAAVMEDLRWQASPVVRLSSSSLRGAC